MTALFIWKFILQMSHQVKLYDRFQTFKEFAEKVNLGQKGFWIPVVTSKKKISRNGVVSYVVSPEHKYIEATFMCKCNTGENPIPGECKLHIADSLEKCQKTCQVLIKLHLVDIVKGNPKSGKVLEIYQLHLDHNHGLYLVSTLKIIYNNNNKKNNNTRKNIYFPASSTQVPERRYCNRRAKKSAQCRAKNVFCPRWWRFDRIAALQRTTLPASSGHFRLFGNKESSSDTWRSGIAHLSRWNGSRKRLFLIFQWLSEFFRSILTEFFKLALILYFTATQLKAVEELTKICSNYDENKVEKGLEEPIEETVSLNSEAKGIYATSSPDNTHTDENVAPNLQELMIPNHKGPGRPPGSVVNQMGLRKPKAPLAYQALQDYEKQRRLLTRLKIPEETVSNG